MNSFVGGRTKGEGRGVHHKAIVIGAIEVRPRKAPVKGARRTFYAGRLRLRLVPNREAKSLTKFVRENVAKGAVVHTDGWTGYDDLEALGYVHKPLVIDGDPERIEAHLPMIHIAFSNLKSWLLGTHHGVSHRHLQAYLNEFVFRFNRRFYPMTAFNSALGLAAHASAPTYKKLYSGDWTHPATGLAANRIGKVCCRNDRPDRHNALPHPRPPPRLPSLIPTRRAPTSAWAKPQTQPGSSPWVSAIEPERNPG